MKTCMQMMGYTFSVSISTYVNYSPLACFAT